MQPFPPFPHSPTSPRDNLSLPRTLHSMSPNNNIYYTRSCRVVDCGQLLKTPLVNRGTNTPENKGVLYVLVWPHSIRIHVLLPLFTFHLFSVPTI